MGKKYVSLLAVLGVSTVMLTPVALADAEDSDTETTTTSSAAKGDGKDSERPQRDGSGSKSKSDSESKDDSNSDDDEGKNDNAISNVIAVGDSNLWSMRDKYMGDEGFESQLEDSGFDVTLDSSPGRSMKEEVKGNDPDGNYTNVTDSLDELSDAHDGENAIWVMAEGVNDSANVQAGSSVSNEERIAGVMDKLGDDVTVVWPTVAVGEGAPDNYNSDGADNFNEALEEAAKEHDNLVVMHWDKAVQPDWFKDGVHYKVEGYKAYIDLLIAHLKAVQDGKLGVDADGSADDDIFDDVKDEYDYAELVVPEVNGADDEDSDDSGSEDSSDSSGDEGSSSGKAKSSKEAESDDEDSDDEDTDDDESDDDYAEALW